MTGPQSYCSANQTAAPTTRVLECSVGACATVRMTYDEVNALRKQSASLPGNLGNSLLRHTDEQTLTALAAANLAIKQLEDRSSDFGGWGVVCSSRYLGRTSFADSLVKFAAEGPWNVSVQVVPNRSLHAPASMIGLALGCHGPCVGVGGGLDGEPDAWITAITLLDQRNLPGIFLVFIGWEPDEHIDITGKPLTESRCTSLILALEPSGTASEIARLKIGRNNRAPNDLEVPAKRTAMSQVEESIATGTERLQVMLGGGLSAEVQWAEATSRKLPVPDLADQRRAA